MYIVFIWYQTITPLLTDMRLFIIQSSDIQILGSRAQDKSGEVVLNAISAVLNKGGCSGLLYFIGNNSDYIAMYPDRYIPNLFPGTDAAVLTHWFRKPRNTTKSKAGIFVLEHSLGCTNKPGLTFFTAGVSLDLTVFPETILNKASKNDRRLLSALRTARSKPTLRRESQLALSPIPSKSKTATPMELDQSGCADTAAARKLSVSRAMATADPTVDAAALLLMGMSPTPASAPSAAPPTALPDAAAFLLMGTSQAPTKLKATAGPVRVLSNDGTTIRPMRNLCLHTALLILYAFANITIFISRHKQPNIFEMA
jgi:hypothetical protein